MNCYLSAAFSDADAYILPFLSSQASPVALPRPELQQAAEYLLQSSGEEVQSLDILLDGRRRAVTAVRLEEPLTPRMVYLRLAKALRRCRTAGAKRLDISLDSCPQLCRQQHLFETVVRLTELVNYENRGQKHVPGAGGYESAALVTAAEGLENALEQALACAEGTLIARELCNRRASHQTPLSLAADAKRLCGERGCTVEILEGDALRELGMDAFLAVARGGAATPPALIVIRYRGGEGPVLGLVGKGIVYDSGGYSLKTGEGMKTMFDDMGGGAAVIGAMCAIAGSRLPVNVVGVVAACENKLGDLAYVPGDIIGSMAGKSIEVLNTDAEGRLTLADALTYAAEKERCGLLVDIATLTGAAKQAVGKYSSAVFSNSDELFGLLRAAAGASSEKIWRLDLDPEMRPVLNSPVADLRNTAGDKAAGGGSMVAALFLQEFAAQRPWAHIDMANVNFRAEPPAFSAPGATGYGAALLYYLARELPGHF